MVPCLFVGYEITGKEGHRDLLGGDKAIVKAIELMQGSVVEIEENAGNELRKSAGRGGQIRGVQAPAFDGSEIDTESYANSEEEEASSRDCLTE